MSWEGRGGDVDRTDVAGGACQIDLRKLVLGFRARLGSAGRKLSKKSILHLEQEV